MAERIKLLIADDEVQYLNALAQRLEIRDFEVTKAVNGQEALQAARREKFDLALLDLKMPGMDGKEVLEHLKKEHKYLEVIILTGHGSLSSAVECTKLGAYGYLPKPYELEGLITILKEAFEARMKNKFKHDTEKMEQILRIATGDSPLGVLRKLRELDDQEK